MMLRLIFNALLTILTCVGLCQIQKLGWNWLTFTLASMSNGLTLLLVFNNLDDFLKVGASWVLYGGTYSYQSPSLFISFEVC